MKTLFVHPERCIGCWQCTFACTVEHSRSRDPLLALREQPPPRPRIHVEPGRFLHTSFPNTCHHCQPAPCREVCPTAALHRDAVHGLVLVEGRKCIACAMCAMVCPFDALTFHPQGDGVPARLVAMKCDGCLDRRERGEIPACVEACKTGALVYGDLNRLVRAGRQRDTRTVLDAAAAEPAAALPDTVAAWRVWGREATDMAGGAP